MGRWVVGRLGQWETACWDNGHLDIWILKYWEAETFTHWDIRSTESWDTGTFRYWNAGSYGKCKTGTLGAGTLRGWELALFRSKTDATTLSSESFPILINQFCKYTGNHRQAHTCFHIHQCTNSTCSRLRFLENIYVRISDSIIICFVLSKQILTDHFIFWFQNRFTLLL